MKQKFKLYILLILTALIFTLENPDWHWLDTIKLHSLTSNGTGIFFVWGEVALAIGALAVIVALLATPFSKFFLGYESKKPDEGDEVFFYVLLTLFVFGLFLIGETFLDAPERDREKDVKYTCELLRENLEFSSKDGTQQKVDDICGAESDDEDSEDPRPKKK